MIFATLKVKVTHLVSEVSILGLLHMATLPHCHMPAILLHLATCQQGYYTWPHGHKAITPDHIATYKQGYRIAGTS